MPVKVEIAEVKKQKSCYCNRDFTEEELRSMVLLINGKEDIWTNANCNIDDKSYQRLTLELNAMFRKHGINECIQKMAFLAMTSVETGFFNTAGEVAGNTSSSQYFYKGRGILQLTGKENEPVMYKDYGSYKTGNENAYTGENANLIASNIHLAVDSGGWVWTNKKSLSYEHRAKNSKDSSQADYEEKMRAFKWKREKLMQLLEFC